MSDFIIVLLCMLVCVSHAHTMIDSSSLYGSSFISLALEKVARTM